MAPPPGKVCIRSQRFYVELMLMQRLLRKFQAHFTFGVKSLYERETNGRATKAIKPVEIENISQDAARGSISY